MPFEVPFDIDQQIENKGGGTGYIRGGLPPAPTGGPSGYGSGGGGGGGALAGNRYVSSNLFDPMADLRKRLAMLIPGLGQSTVGFQPMAQPGAQQMNPQMLQALLAMFGGMR